MAEKKRGGCRKAAMWTGMGCLAIPVLGLIFAVVSLGWGFLFYNHDDPMRAEPTSLSIPLGGEGEATEGIQPGVDFEQLQNAQGRGRPPVLLNIDLQEGEFEVRPGPPGSQIQVDGNFDPRDFELSQSTEEGSGEYEKEVTIRFRRKVPLLFFLLRGGFEDGQDMNKVTVTIPVDLPTALDLAISKGESDTDLGGLTLRSLNADLTMGEHDLTFSRPLQGELESASFRLSMGEVSVTRLGNARARQLTVRGRMGEMTADLGGDWPPGFTTRADLNFAMGECRLTVPERVRISPSSSVSMFLGESRSGDLNEGGPQGPDAPEVEIHASAKLGEFRIIRN